MTKFPMIKICNIFYLVVIAYLSGSSCLAGTIVDTKHNLSASGPGDVRALTEDKICVFCHTPHNATPYTPLWNKKIEPKAYTLYESHTLSVVPGQPSGPTRLCLSCHDGTIALGEVVKPPKPLLPGQEILMRGSDKLSSGKLSSSARSYLGTDLSNDHPVSFSYYAALENNPELADTLPSILHTYGAGNIHCTTCHDPHDNTFEKFLVMSNKGSKLCITCHDNKTGWSATTHATSARGWDPPGVEPSQTVAEHGCGSCHVPHGGEGRTRLLRFLKEEDNCYSCHNGGISAATNIEAQFGKPSHHPVEDTTIGVTINYHDRADDNDLFLQGHVECVDCHNPHATNDSEAEPSAEPPTASGRLAGVSGRNTSGAVVNPLKHEYELCFKCHADSGNTVPVIARWIDQNDTMVEFDTGNPSYHPVVAGGKNPAVLSLFPAAEQLNEGSIISCVDCHDSNESSAIGDTGPRGPHGSTYKPILRQQYGEDGISFIAESLTETTLVYALCYRCHDRNTLFSDTGGTSFRSEVGASGNLHTKHVRTNKIPCYMCHDPHGVQEDGNGHHTHLINFASTVSAYTANPTPFFTDMGSGIGSCTLVCHNNQTQGNQTHDGVTSGIYPPSP